MVKGSTKTKLGKTYLNKSWRWNVRHDNLSPGEFGQCVDRFIQGHVRWSGILSNKDAMEKLGLSHIYESYQTYCRSFKLGECLGCLYSLVSTNKSWFKKDNVKNFAADIDSFFVGTELQGYDNYLPIIEELAPLLKVKFGGGDIIQKFGNVRGAIYNIRSIIEMPDGRKCHQYFSDADQLFWFLVSVIRIAEDEHML